MLSRNHSNPSISCVIPAFNEAPNLPRLLVEVVASLSLLSKRLEVIVVDDGSSDNTAQLMQELCGQQPQLVYLQLSRNFGKECALTAGLEAALGEVVLLMDGDGQHPVALAARMLQQWRAGSDVVYAVRRSRSDQSGLHIKLIGWFYKLINLGSRVKIPADAGDFRLMDRQVVEALKRLPEHGRFMKGLYAWVGFNSTAIDYEPLARLDGKSNFGLRSSMSLALTGMLAFSVAPLRMLTVSGLLLALLALSYGLWVVAEYFLIGNPVRGYPTLVASIMFFSGVQLLSIGILAEYVGRIYEEVKQRPNYLVSQRTGSGLASPTDVSDVVPQS